MNSFQQKLLFLFWFFCAGLYQSAFPQTADERAKSISAAIPVIDGILQKHATDNHFPGMVYGLVVDGKLVHTGNMGYANLEKKINAGNSAAFRVASMTKSFTAMAILKLRDAGMLQLDDPVYLYIPEMKAQKYPAADAPAITIRHLLTHAAGFPEDNPWGDRQLATTDQQLIDLIKKGISFSANPGQQYEYSNLGFAMLGYIIKKVSGLHYADYITRNILLPLGMTHTYWEYTNVPADKLAHGYRWLNGKWVEQPMLHDGTYGAMGGMITTIDDFSKYVAFHLAAWPATDAADDGPVKRSSVREMHFPWNFIDLNADTKYATGRACAFAYAYGYGLAWARDCGGRVFLGHSGGLPGFGSNWKILPAYNIGILTFSNLTYASTSAINLQVLDTLVALAKLKPRQIPVSPILTQRKAELLSLLPDWKNATSTGIFADNFFLDYFPDDLRTEATGIFKKAGKIIRVGELVPENNLRGSFIIEGEQQNIEVRFTLSPETPALIQEYGISLLKKRA